MAHEAHEAHEDVQRLIDEDLRMTEELKAVREENARLQHQMALAEGKQRRKENELRRAMESVEGGDNLAEIEQLRKDIEERNKELQAAKQRSEELEGQAHEKEADRERVTGERDELLARAQREHDEAARKRMENMNLYRRIDQLTMEKAALLGGEQLAPDEVKDRYRADAITALNSLMGQETGSVPLDEVAREMEHAHELGATADEMKGYREFYENARKAQAEAAVHKASERLVTAKERAALEKALEEASLAGVKVDVTARAKSQLTGRKQEVVGDHLLLAAEHFTMKHAISFKEYERAAMVLKEAAELAIDEERRAPLFVLFFDRKGRAHAACATLTRDGL
jgi:hypothetical protein